MKTKSSIQLALIISCLAPQYSQAGLRKFFRKIDDQAHSAARKVDDEAHRAASRIDDKVIQPALNQILDMQSKNEWTRANSYKETAQQSVNYNQTSGAAFWQKFNVAGVNLVHTFVSIRPAGGQAPRIGITIDAGRIGSPSNVLARDPQTGVQIINQSVGNTEKNISAYDSCLAQQVGNNTGSCRFNYGVTGVCHNHTERVLHVMGRTLGYKFNKVPGDSGSLSFKIYGQFGKGSFVNCTEQAQRNCAYIKQAEAQAQAQAQARTPAAVLASKAQVTNVYSKIVKRIRHIRFRR